MATLTPKQKRRLEKIVSAETNGIQAILSYLFEIEDKLEDKLDAGKPTEEELVALIDQLIPEVEDGEDGVDYVLTEADKAEIASKIEVPVVKQIVEKHEIIREQPIVTEITKEVTKEVAVTDNAEQIASKLNSLTGAIDKSAIKGFEDLERIVKENATPVRLGVSKSELEAVSRRVTALESNPAGIGTPVSPTTGELGELVFGFSTRPSLICVDGIFLREDHGWTWDGSSATLESPPSYDIYAL